MTTIEKCKQLIDSELERFLPEKEPGILYNSMREHIFAGGKRIRPVFCLLACEACNGNIKKALPVATAIELVQAFGLIHDDIMDRDEMRRGIPTMWKKHGDALAICIGDGIFAKGFEALAEYTGENSQDILKVFTEGIMSLCEGQTRDLLFEKRPDTGLEEYYDISKQKTGAQIAYSLKLGAMIAGASKEVQDALQEAGLKFGVAYQLWDDYIDFASENTGKTKGSDIKKGKRTSIVCHALQNLGGIEKNELLTILNASVEETTDEMIERVIRIMRKAGSIEFAKEQAGKFIEEGKQKLAVLEESQAKKEILKIFDFCVDRNV